jgi:hypothetical protein
VGIFGVGNDLFFGVNYFGVNDHKQDNQ